MNCRYKAYYFEEFPINRLTLCNQPHLYHDGVKTGGMTKDNFLLLKDSIEKNGLINPIVVEVDSGSPPRYRICMGNNRVEALILLGKKSVRSLVIHRARTPTEEDGKYERISDNDLVTFMEKAHPGDDLWKKSAWAQRIISFAAQRNANMKIVRKKVNNGKAKQTGTAQA